MSTPIETVPLMREVNAALLHLLESLDADDWKKPTVHPRRDVKDLVAHLLDGSLKRLSIQRDGHFLDAPEIRSFEDTVAFIQRLNTEWMVAAKRFSPRLLIEWLHRTDQEVVELFARIDPHTPAPFGVAWAGEEWSPSWFDIAREYTEKWHHQQQIRDAVGRPGLMERRYLNPVLETFLRGAPHAYRSAAAPDGTCVRITITGEAGGTWFLFRQGESWELRDSAEGRAAAAVTIDADTAWRLWTKGIDRQTARARAVLEGDEGLCAPLFEMVTIMA
ncbi:maleylpyruvate isomerase N-terminal domain-containing protein [Polyangium aurulentum]|uniref:maleylpyruvate isomerase N-terminal domain-containing protein n=1 Tax=Polyangium aurulentum TaxID=2567896 RepID=UPI0010ADEAAF|nr:maleylpyruvate isomerase N-terminal domain-containing protein [Polyangium aurulentum]UQA55253.1 maleylpyruvate isomerase N-terminal domain-containing protein [Polyangium aurulentum]